MTNDVAEALKALNAIVFDDGERCWADMTPLQQAVARLSGAIEVEKNRRLQSLADSAMIGVDCD